MAKNTVEIELKLLDRMSKDYKQISGIVKGRNRELRNSLKNVEGQTKKTSSSFIDFRVVMAGVAGFIGGKFVGGLIDAQRSITKVNNALTVGTGSTQAAKIEYEFLRQETSRLGLDLQSTALSYSKLTAATRETALEGQPTREIFLGVSEAAAALGLSADDSRGALNAFQQMVSKGNVQAEELRGQLGERIPGAFNMAAKAMGLTTVELNKQLELGRVTAADMLPKLAAEMRKTFGPQAAKGPETMAGKINLMRNEMFEFQSMLLEMGGEDLIKGTLGELSETLEEVSVILKRNEDVIVDFGVSFGVVMGGASDAVRTFLRGWEYVLNLVTISWNQTLKQIAQGALFVANVFDKVGVDVGGTVTFLKNLIGEFEEASVKAEDRVLVAVNEQLNGRKDIVKQIQEAKKAQEQSAESVAKGPSEDEKKAVEAAQKVMDEIAILEKSGLEQRLEQIDQFEKDRANKIVEAGVNVQERLDQLTDVTDSQRLRAIEEHEKAKQDVLERAIESRNEITMSAAEFENFQLEKNLEERNALLREAGLEEIQMTQLVESKQREIRESNQKFQEMGQRRLTDALISESSRGLQALVKNEKRSKAIATATAVIQGAVAFQRALANPPGPPFSIPQALATLAMTAGQVATINAQRFAQGGFVQGGPAFGDRTSVLANRGEAILNTAQQRNFMRLANGGGGRSSVHLGDTVIHVTGNADPQAIARAVEQTNQEKLRNFSRIKEEEGVLI